MCRASDKGLFHTPIPFFTPLKSQPSQISDAQYSLKAFLDFRFFLTCFESWKH